MSTSHNFTTTDADYGLRLDQVLAAHVESLSRTKARALLALGGVFVDGHRTKVAGRLMRGGQEIAVHLGALLSGAAQALPELLAHLPDALFEDEQLLVIEKESGLFSAPTPESDQNNLLALLERRAQQKLHLIHRLDRPTSGLIVVAKTAPAAAFLSAQFQEHSISRLYLAILVGQTPPEGFAIDLPIEQKPARTSFTTLQSKRDASLVRAELFTGRTHQVRLHAESAGHPVAGDSKYGRPRQRTLTRRPARLALHATRLGFLHPDGRRLDFESALPAELQAYWDQLG